ncbi:restriction endonuclease subunit S [Mycobacterium sp. 852014-50255_SCH5639931]|uniref:restriction endonuclease subunit S n=1 Tax=Mycobacterium sp. 852014-50255_SCH5639931 TaxID=1834112 RepID=UPI0007FDEC5D|nr:restriction endonuclease subunit S [Mycobacterium sp. 852014-50255_SCH5639931]OBB62889.1 hypothetical protein A5758_24805 [Mycobacterium sp. 852014-50255_SCH5639931]
MSRIDGLVTDGDVKWSTLGSICIKVSSGATPLAGRGDYYDGGDIPWLRTAEVAWRDIYDTEVKITKTAVRETATKWIPANCVIVAISGATAARAAINKIPLTTNQHCCNLEVDPEQANYRYVFHWVTANYEKLKAFGRGARSDLNAELIKNFPIPLPSLEKQREIVRVLDELRSLEMDLEAALGAELGARTKQYEFVVSRVISGIDGKHETLRDLGNWRGGMTPSKSDPRYWESGTIPWLASMDVSVSDGRVIRGRVTPVALAETPLRVVPSPSVVVVMRSNILRRRLPVGMTTVETTLNQDVKALTPRDGVDAEYVYQVLRVTSEQIRAACVRADGSMAAVESNAFFEWSIPIPSLQDQKRIASQLNAFEAAVSELSISLSAELKARRKQFEYYRDRLLTFEELAV